MYYMHEISPWHYFANTPIYCPGFTCAPYKMHPYPPCPAMPMYHQYIPYCIEHGHVYSIELKDYGPEPFVVNIEKAAKQNNAFRTALWTGKHLQLTLMSIKAGEDIGLEVHPDLDQFIRIEEGQGLVKMGNSRDKLDFQRRVYDDYAFIIPAGKWHNLINTGNNPIKLYSIYAPPQHPYGTVHETKADAIAAEIHGH